MKSLILILSFLGLLLPKSTWQSYNNHLEIDDWELIGSRTYDWEGSEVLRCKHWDKVAIRWHISSCDRDGNCTGGTNVDYATRPQNWTEMPQWRNAFTFVQLPGQDENIQYIRLGLHGYDRRKTKTRSISPLKVDVDWRWKVSKYGCNEFVVRMNAMSMIDDKMRPKLEKFCKAFDKDQFVDCKNL